MDKGWHSARMLLSRGGRSPDAEVDAPITGSGLEAELSLRPLERRGRLIPFSPVLAGVGWLGSERVVAAGYIVV
ncbi:MAG: hypothetical protein ACJ780_23630 [Solirubrobacteraceae bacterium]